MKGLDWTALHWTGLDRTALDWTGLDWTGPHCTALDWTALDWTGLHWTALDRTALSRLNVKDKWRTTVNTVMILMFVCPCIVSIIRN